MYNLYWQSGSSDAELKPEFTTAANVNADIVLFDCTLHSPQKAYERLCRPNFSNFGCCQFDLVSSLPHGGRVHMFNLLLLALILHDTLRHNPIIGFTASMANLKQEEDDPEHAKMSTEIPTSTQTVPSDSVRRSIKQEADITCLIPSFAEACKLIDTPYSCLVLDTHRRHVALPPMHLKKKKTGIEEELNSELLKYSEK